MLNLLIPFIALLGLGFGAPTDSSTSIATFEHTDIVNTSSKWFPIMPTCGPSIRLASQGDCGCWGDSDPYAMPHLYVDEAIVGACDLFAGGIGEPVTVFGDSAELPRSATHMQEHFSNHVDDEGRIQISLVVDPGVEGPIPLSWEFCRDMFTRVLDGCDTDAVDGKNGGYAVMYGLYWIVDPAPSAPKHFPYGGMVG